MNYPVKKVYITQEWGVNGDVYAKFGYKGHNGLDLRLFDENGNKATTCLVFAPHDSVVKERSNDADGYGNYLKIENDIEGSILGHLKEFKVNLGDTVKQGQLIGIADNTGWSTGAHLHWGYYRHPRNKQNGYGGTIDPKPYINQSEENMSDCLVPNTEEWRKKFDNMVGGSANWDEVLKLGYANPAQIKQEHDELKKSLKECREQKSLAEQKAEDYRKDYQSLLSDTAKTLGVIQNITEVKNALAKLDAQLNELHDLKIQFANLQENGNTQLNEINKELEIVKVQYRLLQEKRYSEMSSTQQIKELTAIVKQLIKKLQSIVRKS